MAGMHRHHATIATSFSRSRASSVEPGPLGASAQTRFRTLARRRVASMSVNDGATFPRLPAVGRRLPEPMALVGEPEHDHRVEKHGQRGGALHRLAVPNMRTPRFRVSVSSRPSITSPSSDGASIVNSASPTASRDHDAALKRRRYAEKCFVAPGTAATIIRVTMRRPENNHPDAIVQRLAKLGAVLAARGKSPPDLFLG